MQRMIEVKRRIRTIEDIRGVARTMATVASAKLSRTRQRAAGMRVYAARMRKILQRQQCYVASRGVALERVSPYFVTAPLVRRVLLVHVAADRGMCGNYNIAVNRLAVEALADWHEAGVEVSVLARGAKGASALRRRAKADIVDSAGWPREGVTEPFVDVVHGYVTSAFERGEVDEVWCAYTRFHTPIRREPRLVRLLPIRPDERAEDGLAVVEADLGRWAYEPSFSAIVGEMARMFVRVQVEDVLLESYASEQGARMITMEEATERATKRLHECRVLYNRLRREFVTTDLLGVLYASRVRHVRGGA